MKFENLDARLTGVAKFIPECDKFLDVGTDHAYLPVYLLKNNICKYAIASDLRKGPLKSAEKTVKLYGVSDKVSLRLGSGFETVAPNEVQAAAVAGMGGILISEIIKASEKTVRSIQTLILQPMTAVYELRAFLYNHGFTIDDEVLVKDKNKIYSILKVHSGNSEIPTEAELYIGKHIILKNDEIYIEYKNKLVTKLKKQISGMEKSENSKSKEKLENTKNLLSDIQKLL